MVPTPQIAVAVADKGGPAAYVQENWDKLVGAAQTLADLAVEQGQKV
jgi:hypothetical protein